MPKKSTSMSDGNTSFVYEAGESLLHQCCQGRPWVPGLNRNDLFFIYYRIDLLEEEDTMPFGPQKQFRKSYIMFQRIEKEVRNKPINRVQFGKQIS